MTRLLSSLFGWIARCKRPQLLVQLLIKSFSNHFKISFHKAKKKSFESLNEMFTREINETFDHCNEQTYIHPVEGRLVSFGRVEKNQVFLIKGQRYSLTDLIKDKKDFEDYYFYNYYLSPQDYHRVHHPISGVYKSCYFIKGALYPVADWFVKLMPQVFLKNARTVSHIESAHLGDLYLIMVGAFNVGSMTMFEGYSQSLNKNINCGDQLGIFELGSSVVVLTPLKLDVKENERVCLNKSEYE